MRRFLLFTCLIAAPACTRNVEAQSDPTAAPAADVATAPLEVPPAPIAAPLAEGSAAIEDPAATAVAAPPEHAAAAPCATAPAHFSCVPGGYFVRGNDLDTHDCEQAGNDTEGRPNARPQATIWVDTFYMAVHETTHEEYDRCVDAGDCADSGPQYADFSRPLQPITGVSWYDSRDYCSFIGGHLPTEAEWEKAARGENGETYPWGEDPVDCDRAVIQSDAGRSCGVTKAGNHPETGRVIEVESRPAGRYGLFDMAGNAEEWVADWYSPDYDACGEACLGDNPRGPCDGADECEGHGQRVVRGGSWYWPADHVTGYHRRRHLPSNEYFHHFGFRCAFTAGEAAALLSEGSGVR